MPMASLMKNHCRRLCLLALFGWSESSFGKFKIPNQFLTKKKNEADADKNVIVKVNKRYQVWSVNRTHLSQYSFIRHRSSNISPSENKEYSKATMHLSIANVPMLEKITYAMGNLGFAVDLKDRRESPSCVLLPYQLALSPTKPMFMSRDHVDIFYDLAGVGCHYPGPGRPFVWANPLLPRDKPKSTVCPQLCDQSQPPRCHQQYREK